MNRLKEIRQENGLTLRALGEKINMSSARLSRYENGKREPKLETWQKLANFFHVSVPYLQGIDDKPNNGYSKEYIYKMLDDMYKEDWTYIDSDQEKAIINLYDGKIYQMAIETIGKKETEKMLKEATIYSTQKIVNELCKFKKIKMVNSLDIDFFKNNFSFIFEDNDIINLIKTKDRYSDKELKDFIINELYFEYLRNKPLPPYPKSLTK